MATKKHKKYINKTHKTNNYNHYLHANRYISNAFHKMMQNKGPEEQYDYIYYLVRYGFSDLSIDKCHEIASILLNHINNLSTDHQICNAIYDIYKTVKKENVDGFPMSNKDYNMAKVQEIIRTVGNSNFKKQRSKVLVDVGAGDCVLSKYLGEQNDMFSIAIDIKGDIDWRSSSEQSLCSDIAHIYYNGSNLARAVRSAAGNKDIGMIMYNHSLHHFGSIANMRQSINQAHTLLSKGGILFLREHDKSLTSDIDINLQHILLSLRYTIDNYPHWNKDKLWLYMSNFIKTYTAHFLTKDQFISMCRSAGFRLIRVNKRKFPYTQKNFRDISMTTLIAFIK
jgi:hypothetical protein